jgi:hypothetical protein
MGVLCLGNREIPQQCLERRLMLVIFLYAFTFTFKMGMLWEGGAAFTIARAARAKMILGAASHTKR